MRLYEDLNHIYKHDNQLVTPVTKVLKLFAESYDSRLWALHGILAEVWGVEELKAAKKVANQPVKPSMDWLWEQAKNFPDIDFETRMDALQLKWDTGNKQITDKGSEGHDVLETEQLEAESIRSPFNMKLYPVKIGYRMEGLQKISLVDNLWDLENGVYPEQIIWVDDIYMGTSDQVFIETLGENRYIDIVEHKFVTKIDKRNTLELMKYPIQHVENCRYNRFNLQLSMYAYAFEKVGFIVRKLAINHKGKYLPATYMKLEVIRIVQYFEELSQGLLSDTPYIEELL